MAKKDQKRKKTQKQNQKLKEAKELQQEQLQNKEFVDDANLLTFGGHLEVLRQMLFRILGAAGVMAVLVFCFKDTTWQVLLAPSEWDFVTYRWIEGVIQQWNPDFHFEKWHVDLIATDLSSQFMSHITMAVYLGLLGTSPYILYELFRFVSPALYDNERRYSLPMVIVIYLLFIVGILMSYYILFPISFRFLGTYSVAVKVHSTITLDSYITTFVSLTLVMGLVFQLPVIAFACAKLGLISSDMLSNYRKHAVIVIMTVAAIITPPDIMTLVLVTIPLYLLYEVCIRVVKNIEAH